MALVESRARTDGGYCDLLRNTEIEPSPELALTMSVLPSPLRSVSTKNFLPSWAVLIQGGLFGLGVLD